MFHPKVYIIDDDDAVRDSLSLLLEAVGLTSQSYASAQAFLEDFHADMHGCLLLDVRLPAMSGLELQAHLSRTDCALPIVFITGHGDVPTAVEALKKGAADFLLKPFSKQQLLDSITAAFDMDHQQYLASIEKTGFQEVLARLTPREQEILPHLLRGHGAKRIARQIGISPRTVEWHRTQVLNKLGYNSMLQLLASPLKHKFVPPESAPDENNGVS